MWPQVVQFETRRLQNQRALQLAREIAADRARLETASGTRGARRLRLATFPRRVGWSASAARSRP